MAEQKFLNTLRITSNKIREDARDYIISAYKRAGTLFTAASPFAQIVTVLSEITELIMFYIEDALVEQNIYTAQHPESIYGMSRLTGHDATRGYAAFGEIRFKWNPSAALQSIAGTGLTIDGRAELEFESNGLFYTLLTSKDAFRISTLNKDWTTCSIVPHVLCG